MFCLRKKINYFLFLIIPVTTLLLPLKLNAQATGDPKEDFLYGEYYLMQAMYSEALIFYLSALEANPQNSNVNYRIGLCYSKILGEQHEALPFLQKAVNEINPHYIEGKYYNTGAPMEAWLLLGDAYLRNNQLLDASKAYYEYKNLIGDADDEKYQEFIDRISVLGISYEFQRNDAEVNFINLGGGINSRFSDYNSVVSGDQKTLIYSQFWESYDKILLSNLTEAGWSQPLDISGQIETEGECYTSAISYDGSELYLVCHEDQKYDLYLSVKKDSVWSKMKPLEGKVNSKYRESSVSISADGNELYFASDRPGGQGGFDIYHAKKAGNSWSGVTNLGKPVNTEGNEEGPYISYDGSVLYFSSDGHETVGNMDIFYSNCDSNSVWLEPVNMGAPVNTTNDDLFYIFFKDTQMGYLSRDFPEGYGKNDVYRVDFADNPMLASNGIVLKQISRPITKLSLVDTTSKIALNAIDTVDSVIVNAYEIVEEISTDTTIIEIAELYDTVDTPEIEDFNFIERRNSNIQVDEQVTFDAVIIEEMDLDSLPTYTIQIYALRNPLNVKKLKLKPVRVSHGEDGLFRYTYGEYIGLLNAIPILKEIRLSGYPDAFVRNIALIPNYAR